MSVVVTESIRKAVSQAASLVRQSTRTVFTDQRHARAANANLAADVRETPTANPSVSAAASEKTIEDLPGPTGYPVVGTAVEYFRKPNRGKMHEVQRRFHAKYGRIFKEKLGPVTNVSIADPALVEELFRSEGRYPVRPPYEAWLVYKTMRKRSKGIVSASGEEWHKIRSILNKRLLKPRQAAQYITELNEISQELSRKIRAVRDNESTDKTIPNILNLLYAWSIESISQVLVDRRCGCLMENAPEDMTRFVRSIEDMMYTSHQLMVFSNVHKKLNTPIWRKHVRSWDRIIETAKNILDSKRAEIASRASRNTEGTLDDVTFLEHMLASDNLTTEEIYTNMTECLIAGVDSTSNTVAVAIYLLSRHPEVQERVQREVDNLNLGTGNITLDHLNSIPYIKAVIKETLRLYPIVPTNARVLTEDTVLSGHIIPKNTILMLNTFTMCRDPDMFKDADAFIPDRWLRSEARDFSPFTSLPFGFGARSCVGRRVADKMLQLTVANIIRNYNLKPTEGSGEVQPFVRTVLTLGADLPVEFHDR